MPLALGGGLVAATQARVNGQFSQAVGNPSAAALLSMATGLAILTPVVLLAAPLRAGLAAVPSAVRSGALPRWMLTAGSLGALVLFSQAFAVSSLGVAVYSVVFVASLTGAGLLVDRVGLSPTGPQAVTANRVGGAMLGVAAALVAAAPSLATRSFAIAAATVAVAAGAGGAAQSAMLGRLGAATGRPLAAVWVNFLGGALTLAVIVAVVCLLGGTWALPPIGWLWLGGPLGLMIVATIVLAVRRAGVLLVALSMTAGQMIGSLAWDWGAPVAGRGIDASAVAGAVLLMGAVALAALRAPARRAEPPPST